MAPDAPDPRYNSNGNQVTDWLVVARYDAARDVLTLSWTQDGTLYRSTKQGAIAYPPADLPDLIEGFSTTVHSLGAPRLF